MINNKYIKNNNYLIQYILKIIYNKIIKYIMVFIEARFVMMKIASKILLIFFNNNLYNEILLYKYFIY